jgi:predicted transcriptional regulator
MSHATSPLSLRLDFDVRTRLQQEAYAQDRSLSYVAQKAIIAFLDAKDARYQAISTALAEADKGVFVSDEAITKWIDSWGEDCELTVPKPDVFLLPNLA